ncbi:MAG TPA: glutathione S-transferase family protein [Candidatus Eisenbacteria bacterium]|nr:glutathione S-transferase family protein [Candidatus Eisenbacteria bacterium]
MITVYGVPRSRTMRSLWMLEELGVPYENVKTNFATGDTRKPDYLKVNPNGHVPALRDGDTVLFESLAINLYLARKYDKGLWPKSVEDEGRTFQWSVWAMTELEEPVLTTLLHRMFFPAAQRDPAKADDAAERARKPLGVLEGALAGREYLLGGGFGVADLNVASVLSWAPLAGIDLAPFPAVQAWLTRCTSRPAFQRVQ